MWSREGGLLEKDGVTRVRLEGWPRLSLSLSLSTRERHRLSIISGSCLYQSQREGGWQVVNLGKGGDARRGPGSRSESGDGGAPVAL